MGYSVLLKAISRVRFPARVFTNNGIIDSHTRVAYSILSSANQAKVNVGIENITVGTEYEGFTVKSIQEVEDLALTAVRLSHNKTGADYLHISRDDPNNVFCVGFRTTPKDSTGVSHILEHTVLCGSKQYPARDPFFKMLNRSLATFMNAMT